MKIQANSWKIINSQIFVFGYNSDLRRVSIALNEKTDNLYQWWGNKGILPRRELLLKEGAYLPCFNKYAEINLSASQIFNLDSNTFKYTPSKLYYTVLADQTIKVSFILRNVMTLYQIGSKSTDNRFTFIHSLNIFNDLNNMIELLQPDMCITYNSNSYEFTNMFAQYIYLDQFFEKNMSFDQAFTSILCPYDEPFIVETDLNKIVSIFTKLFYSYDMFIVPFSNACNFEGTIEYLNLLNNLQLTDAKKITFPSLFDVKGIFNDVYVYSIRDVYLHLINEYPSFSLFYSQINQAPRQTVVLFTEKLMASYEQFNTFCQNYLQIFFAFSHNEYLYTQTRNSKIFAHTSYRSIRTDERGTLLINNQNEIIATFKLSSSEYLQINHESGKTIRLTNIERFLLEEKNN